MSTDSEFRTRVWALHAEGLSNRAIGRALDSNHVAIAKVLSEALPAPLPAHMARPAPPTPEDFDGDAPALQVVRELLTEARRKFASASAAGDSGSAQRYARTAAGLTPVLARLEAADAATDGVATFADLAVAEQMIESRIKALSDRGPIMCAGCSRRLSIFWGTGQDSEGEFDHAEAPDA